MKSKRILEIARELRKKISLSVEESRCDSLLFSGGLDTAILAYEISNLKKHPPAKCIHVYLEPCGEDTPYARELCKILNLKLCEVRVTVKEAISAIPEIIKILKTFDPAIPNDLAIYFGVRCLKELKLKRVVTGDGSDELFGGYEYMKGIKDLNGYIKKISKTMSFSSNKICQFFGVECIQPYKNRRMIELALSIPSGLKIAEKNDILYGKWILRKAYEGLLPEKFLWQTKRPIEAGSGFEKIRSILESRFSDEEFKRKRMKYNVEFMSKEHLYYFEIYKKVVGEIPPPRGNEKKCIFCGGGVPPRSSHCRICGGILNKNF